MGLVRFSNCLIAKWFDFWIAPENGKENARNGKKVQYSDIFQNFKSSTIQILGKKISLLKMVQTNIRIMNTYKFVALICVLLDCL